MSDAEISDELIDDGFEDFTARRASKKSGRNDKGAKEGGGRRNADSDMSKKAKPHRHKGLEISFDPTARSEYLLNFHKRKEHRRLKAATEILRKEKTERKQMRKDKRDEVNRKIRAYKDMRDLADSSNNDNHSNNHKKSEAGHTERVSGDPGVPQSESHVFNTASVSSTVTIDTIDLNPDEKRTPFVRKKRERDEADEKHDRSVEDRLRKKAKRLIALRERERKNAASKKKKGTGKKRKGGKKKNNAK
eukprot:comp15743_c0_seq1/m.24329 comp15743_c0_seq1/g.24329  ORF comp15743_c0_seq1/g.24329 comp15743_c0_seq1/m.24329 type:complete len:248 (+) comp15743_c0_seq1:13-756(+)